MNIVETSYQVIEDLKDKSIEELKSETNILWQQMEMIGNMGVKLAADAGKRLNVIKEKVGHGNFKKWCEENLEFSHRKANNMQKLALEFESENCIFSKTQTSANIGISMVYELLAQPKELAQEITETVNLEETTIKELREEIKKIKEKNQEREQNMIYENQDLEDALDIIKSEKEEIEKEIIALRNQLEEAENFPQNDEKEIVRLKEELEKALLELEDTKAESKEDYDAMVERIKIIEESQKKEVEELKNKSIQEKETIKQELENKIKQLENNKPKAQIDLNTAVFKVKIDELQNVISKIYECIKNEKDELQSEKMKIAFKTVLKQLLKEE